MDILTLSVVALIAINSLLLIWVLRRTGRNGPDKPTDQLATTLESIKADILARQLETLSTLRGSLDNAGTLINERLSASNLTLDSRLRVIGDIEHRLGELAEQAKKIEQVGKNIQSLSDLLKPPKLRGSVGESLLENLLGQVLPPQLFETQFQFTEGQRVDAVVKLGDCLVPIDSKFPLESFQRLQSSANEEQAKKDFYRVVRKHIDDISKKYVRPDEGTSAYALMYIPSEAVYFQIISQDDNSILEYALSKHVIPSAPGHLYAFLATLSTLCRQIGLNSSGKQLIAAIDRLAESLKRLGGYNERIDGSLRSLSSTSERIRQETSAMTTLVDKLQQPEFEPERATSNQ